MIFGFDFQRDEVSFSFLLSHPTALSCIGGAHKAGYVVALHQGAQNVKLLLFLVGDDVLPRFREDGQIIIAPFLETLVIPASISKGHQMPDAPAHQIVVSLQISVVLLRGPDHARNAAGDTRFFCNH